MTLVSVGNSPVSIGIFSVCRSLDLITLGRRSSALAALVCVHLGFIDMMSPCLASSSPRQLAPVPMVRTQAGIVVAAAAAASPSSVDETLSHGSAAHSRMLECGHQWSAMKKAGTATGTWKEFARICLNKD
jgi:hypothetical protein